jgi:hypothetical protein
VLAGSGSEGLSQLDLLSDFEGGGAPLSLLSNVLRERAEGTGGADFEKVR